jgi:putative N-acetyltransferase (TIGR04045 family)
MRRPVCRAAITPGDVREHHRIRHAVFVDEQAIFPVSDCDDNDRRTDVIRVLGLLDEMPAGTVRLFPLDDDREQWQGDRLSVLPAFRVYGLGKPLVGFATSTAASLGGVEMIAHIQSSNVGFFHRLGWINDGPVELYVGVPHQPMKIDLTALLQTSPVTDSPRRSNTVMDRPLSPTPT